MDLTVADEPERVKKSKGFCYSVTWTSKSNLGNNQTNILTRKEVFMLCHTENRIIENQVCSSTMLGGDMRPFVLVFFQLDYSHSENEGILAAMKNME